MNKLNGIENFGHGLPEDGIVMAGITDVPQSMAAIYSLDEDPEVVAVEEEEIEEEEEMPTEEVI